MGGRRGERERERDGGRETGEGGRGWAAQRLIGAERRALGLDQRRERCVVFVRRGKGVEVMCVCLTRGACKVLINHTKNTGMECLDYIYEVDAVYLH